MSVFKPFRAVRPKPEFASQVAELPYDVMNSDEARDVASGNPYSFLRVDKAEIDLPADTDIYDEKVYLKARENLDMLEKNGITVQDAQPCFYIYTLKMNGRSQTGIVGCASIDDYMNDVIKKHEHMRAEKELDRIRHVDYCNANTGPIFLTYRTDTSISATVDGWKKSHAPNCDFVKDGISHTVWVIDDPAVNNSISLGFADIPSLYIADGHHRCSSAVKVGKMRREQNPGFDGTEEFNFFLAVAFPEDELEIMDYNRLIRDTAGYSRDQLLTKISENFSFEVCPPGKPFKPSERHTFGMYIEGRWYKLTARDFTFDEDDPVESLDVSILQNNLIAPIFGITDPKTDERIDFVGGIRGIGELERRVNDDMAIAFSMYPTSLSELFGIADAGKIMPPKSTWFEPKLLSGLFIHKLS